MPLVLSLKESQDFFVGEERFVVDNVYSETRFTIWHEGTGKTHMITDEIATEVLPDVFISSGDRHSNSTASVAIDAPSNIMVLRGDKKRNPPDKVRKRERNQ
jgi:hypothetical protein